MSNIKMICPHCGSDKVTASLECYWCEVTQKWQVSSGEELHGLGYCGECHSDINSMETLEIPERVTIYDEKIIPPIPCGKTGE